MPHLAQELRALVGGAPSSQAGAVTEVAITDAGLNSNKFWTGFYIYTLIFNFKRQQTVQWLHG